MGGGLAIAASVREEMYSSMTSDMQAQFVAYETECKKQNLSQSESFEYLLGKYESLYNSKDENERRKAFKTKTGDILSPTAIMSMWLSQSDDISGVSGKHGDIADGELYDRMKHINSLELDTHIDAHSRNLLGQVFDVENVEGRYMSAKVAIKKPEPVDNVVVVNESTFIHPVTGDLHKRYECSVCKIKFDSQKLIQAHIAHSDIHAANLKQRAILEASRYRAQQQQLHFKAATVDLILKGFQKFKYNYSLPLARQRWHRAANWAICLRWKQIYYDLTKKMCFVPNTVHVMFAGNKVFYRKGGTVTVHISQYHHTQCHTIEIVPHIVSIASSDAATAPVTPAAAAAGEESDGAAAPSAEQQYFIALPRIYLDYNCALGALMGNMKQESGLLASTESVKTNARGGRVVRRTASMEVSIENTLNSYLNSHLKMAKPAKSKKSKKGEGEDGHDGGSGGTHRRKSHGSVPPADPPAVSLNPESRKMSVSSGTLPVAAKGCSPSNAAAAAQHTDSISRSRAPTISASASRSVDETEEVKITIRPTLTTGRSKEVKYQEKAAPHQDKAAAVAVSSELDEIMQHLNEYTITFDGTGMSPDIVLAEIPEELVPVAAVCADQVYNCYEPTENK